MEHLAGPFVAFGLVWVAVGLVALATTIIWLWALIDCLQRDFDEPMIKLLWALVIIFTHFIGAILYLAIGRSQGVRR